MAKGSSRRLVDAQKVHQWLPQWEDVEFDSQAFRSRPSDHFFLFNLPAADLRLLSGIARRSVEGGIARSRDLGIQRRHDSSRSGEIREFVVNGFPWSSLSEQRKASGSFNDLKKPGWLPTAIVVNILKPDDVRGGAAVHHSDLIEKTNESAHSVTLALPEGFDEPDWKPSSVAPVEVIDGQHRLWAFEDRDFAKGFSLPVVAFYGLDISWQAYLFYTINIKPKRINTSLAFDLYPLLRHEDWLERFEGHPIYRETRAQEITEALWAFPKSPWYQRIDMLGGKGGVTQAAWIRSLLATFVKSFEGKRTRIGGLFGSVGSEDIPALPWPRTLQAAYVILLWQELERAVSSSQDEWVTELRAQEPHSDVRDPAFAGRHSLLNTDQGVRAVLAVANDLSWLQSFALGLFDLDTADLSDEHGEGPTGDAIDALKSSISGAFLRDLGGCLASYDWRTSAAAGLSAQDRQSKGRFRGSSGYKELRIDVLHHLATGGTAIEEPALKVAEILGV